MRDITLRRTLFALYGAGYVGKKANDKRDIKKFIRFIRKCNIINVKKGLSDSRPCKRCLNILKEHGFQRVYYSIHKNIKMEKIKYMENEHLSSKYRKPWGEF